MDFCDREGKAVDTIILAGENGNGKSTIINELFGNISGNNITTMAMEIENEGDIIRIENKNGRKVILFKKNNEDIPIDNLSSGEKQINIEVQQTNTGANPKRSRYYMSLLDANALNPGDNFDKLPETYLIFITEDDALQRGLPIIHFSQKADEDGLEFGDGTHYIYVDSSQHTDTKLGKLMHDFRCKNPDDMGDNVLTNRIRVLKETAEGVETMCREMEEIRNEGLTEGELERARQIAIRLSKSKMSIEEIADTVGESVQLVKKWLSESTTPIC